MKEQFSRICPVCNKEVFYKDKYTRNKTQKQNLKCKNCANAQLSISYTGSGNPFHGKQHDSEYKRASSVRVTKRFSDPSEREKISKTLTGKYIGPLAPMYGKTVYGTWIEKYGQEKADELLAGWKKKQSKNSSGKNNPMYGKPSPTGSGNGWSGWYKDWYFRSILELSYMVDVIEKNHSKWISGETDELSVKYIDEHGSTRTYFADFLVDDKFLIECKPVKLWETSRVKIKAAAAKKFCKILGYEYVLVEPEKISSTRMIELFKDSKIKFIERYDKKFREKYLRGD